MSASAGRLAILASGVQGGGGHAVPAHDTLLVMLLIAAQVAIAALIVVHLRRHRPRGMPVADEWRALAMMGELCPHGWQAQINLYGWGAPVPQDAPPSRSPLVELKWQQFDEEPGRVVVARRVWAPTIARALQSMIEDRRTDLALEEIERASAEDEDAWWND